MKTHEKKKSWLATLGSFGSAITVGFCPVCIPAVGALLSAIGLGFLVKEVVLQPLLIAFILSAWFGYVWSYVKEHRVIYPLILGIFAGISLYLGRYVYVGSAFNAALTYGGIVAMIGASVWNIFLGKRQASCPSCISDNSK